MIFVVVFVVFGYVNTSSLYFSPERDKDRKAKKKKQITKKS